MTERMNLPGHGAKRTGLDADEHAQLGQDLQQLQHYLLALQATFHQRYGKTKYCSLKLAEVGKACEILRYTMDDLASAEQHRQPGTFYYGQPEPEAPQGTSLPRLHPPLA